MATPEEQLKAIDLERDYARREGIALARKLVEALADRLRPLGDDVEKRAAWRALEDAAEQLGKLARP